MLTRTLGTAGLFVLGVVVAVSGGVLSLMTVRLLGATLPAGVLFSLVVTGLFFRLGRVLLARAGAFGAVLGWVLGVSLLLWPRPEGDVLLPGTWNGVAFLVGGAVAGTWTLGRAVLGHGDGHPLAVGSHHKPGG